MMNTPSLVLSAFGINGAIDKVALFGSGHINDTYKVQVADHTYLLQKLNSKIFREPSIIENNKQQLFRADPGLFVRCYKTSNDRIHHKNETGVWRLMDFVSNAYAPEIAGQMNEVREVARGFGKFIVYTDTFNVEDFKEPIPDFHNLNWRLDQLEQAIQKAVKGRLETSNGLIERAGQFNWIAGRFQELIDKGLPKRVCHNDTKLNNCLLSKKDQKFMYIIDLDTVGPGYMFFDFGDLMRTTLSPTPEGEADESLIHLRSDYYQALKEGFMKSCEHVLSPIETDNLWFAGLYMTYITALRFLTDYLNGDIYYKVSFENENWVRARNQLKLLELMEGSEF